MKHHFISMTFWLGFFWAFTSLTASAQESVQPPSWLELVEAGKPSGLLNQCSSLASVTARQEWNPDRDLQTLEPSIAVQSVLEFNGLSPDLSRGMPEGNRAGVVAYFRALVQSDDTFAEAALRYLNGLRASEPRTPARFQERLDQAMTFVATTPSRIEQTYRALQVMALYGHRSNPLPLLPIDDEIEPSQCRPIFVDTAIPTFRANRLAANEPSILATFLGCRAARAANAGTANLESLVAEYLKVLELPEGEQGHELPFEPRAPHVAGFKKGFSMCRD